MTDKNGKIQNKGKLIVRYQPRHVAQIRETGENAVVKAVTSGKPVRDKQLKSIARKNPELATALKEEAKSARRAHRKSAKGKGRKNR